MPSRRRSALLAIAVVIGCHRTPAVPDGDIAASLTAPPIAGVFDPAALKGKPTLVMFMTPTCTHCLTTLPRAMAAAAAQQAHLVAVFVAGEAANARGVVEHLHYKGPALVDDGTLRKRYEIKSVPYVMVLAADGHAVDAYVGEQDVSTFADALADAR